MTRVDISLGATVVTVSMDDAVSSADRLWGVVAVRLVDELTGQPPKNQIQLTTSDPFLSPRVAEDGLIGLVGIPKKVFPFLNTASHKIDLTILVQGYVKRHLMATVPMDATFPSNYSPLVLADLTLHRLPIVLKGRTVRTVAGSTQAHSGVNVRISGVWRTPPPANLIVPPDPPNLVCIRTPLYADRSNTLTNLRRRNLSAVTGDDKQLLDPQPAGAPSLRLSNQQGLYIGGILLIDSDLPDREEYLPIQAIHGGSTPDQVAELTLEFQTAFLHRQSALVQPSTAVGTLGANNALAQDAISGDTTLFLNGLSGLSTARQVRVSDGASADEYHDIVEYATQSDSNGYYRLPPISRVAQVEMEAYDGIRTVKTVVSPNYEQSENLVDFVFR